MDPISPRNVPTHQSPNLHKGFQRSDFKKSVYPTKVASIRWKEKDLDSTDSVSRPLYQGWVSSSAECEALRGTCMEHWGRDTHPVRQISYKNPDKQWSDNVDWTAVTNSLFPRRYCQSFSGGGKMGVAGLGRNREAFLNRLKRTSINTDCEDAGNSLSLPPASVLSSVHWRNNSGY